MQKYIDKEFFSAIDRGGRRADGYYFRNCQFVNCGFSLTDDISQRSYASNIKIVNSHVCSSHFGPAVVENTEIDGLTTDDTTTFYGALFRRVSFLGKIGRIVLSRRLTSLNVSPEAQHRLDEEREAFYADTEWALDISEAYFEELDIVGIPAELIRRDRDRQFVITRASAFREGWRDRVGPNCEYWTFVIDQFLHDNDPSTVLVAPMTGTKRKQQALNDGLRELRDSGVLI